jgi:hypothetical protein
VREDLSKSQQAVQAGHAIAEFLLSHKDTEWKNGTLVYLRSPGDWDLYNWIERSLKERADYMPFYEPDLDNEITALAILGSGNIPKMLEDYRLV